MPRSVTVGAEPLQQSVQQIAVGVVDGGAAARGSRLDHFVAGGEDCHFKPPPHLDVRDAERGGERDVLRFQHGAGRQHDMTGGHVFAGQPAIRPKFQPLGHGDAIALRGHVLLHEHRIGALGHRRAGENADGFAGFQRLLRACAGGQAASDDERRVAVAFEISMAHGVTIDRGIVERRQIDRRLDVIGGDAAVRGVQRQPFSFGDRRDALADQPFHVLERQQRTGKGETVVGQLRHGLPFADGLNRHRVLEQQIGNRIDVVQVDHRHLGGR